MTGIRRPMTPPPPSKFGPGATGNGAIQAKRGTIAPPPVRWPATGTQNIQAKAVPASPFLAARVTPPPPRPVSASTVQNQSHARISQRLPMVVPPPIPSRAGHSAQPAIPPRPMRAPVVVAPPRPTSTIQAAGRSAAAVAASSRLRPAMTCRGSVVQKMDMDIAVDSGFSAFGRPDFHSSVANIVTNNINSTLSSTGYSTVSRSDFDIAHKVPFEAIKNKVMSYIYKGGSTQQSELVSKTDVLYTQNKTRYPHMKQKREDLFKLIKRYGYMEKGPTLIMDAANGLLGELNSAYDNLGFGYPSENRSLGARPDPVVVSWNSTTSTIAYSPRTDAIDDEWNLTGSLAYDSSGHPRSSQVTSYFY